MNSSLKEERMKNDTNEGKFNNKNNKESNKNLNIKKRGYNKR